MDRVVAVAVFYVATHGMSHVGRVDTNLVLAASLQAILYKRVLGSAVEYMIMRYGILAAIVHGRRVGDVSLVVLKPVGNSSVVVLHLSAHHSHISAVVHYLMPVVLQNLLCVDVLGINHQSACVAVETMHNMCAALLSRLVEIVVEQRLKIKR